MMPLLQTSSEVVDFTAAADTATAVAVAPVVVKLVLRSGEFRGSLDRGDPLLGRLFRGRGRARRITMRRPGILKGEMLFSL